MAPPPAEGPPLRAVLACDEVHDAASLALAERPALPGEAKPRAQRLEPQLGKLASTDRAVGKVIEALKFRGGRGAGPKHAAVLEHGLGRPPLGAACDLCRPDHDIARCPS